MYSDYKNYITNIRNNLIQCGVCVPDGVFFDLSDYRNLFTFCVKLEDVLLFYKVLAVSGSKYALEDFFLPLNVTYKEKIRKDCYNDFIASTLPVYKSLSADEEIGHYSDTISNGNESLYDLEDEEELGDIFDEVPSAEGYSSVSEVVQTVNTSSEYLYVSNGVYLEDENTQSFLDEIEFVDKGVILEDVIFDEDVDEENDEFSWDDMDEDIPSWGDEEDDFISENVGSGIDSDFSSEEDEADFSSSWGDEEDEVFNFDYEEYEEDDGDDLSSWGEDEEDEADFSSTWGEDDEEESDFSSSWGEDEDEEDDDLVELSTWGEDEDEELLQVEQKIANTSMSMGNTSIAENTSIERDLGDELQDITNSVLTNIKKGVLTFLNRKD